MDWRNRIVIDPVIHYGEPCIKGTRVPLSVIAGVATVTSYDASKGTGDVSATAYVGGTCNGSTFDKTGATATGTSKAHLAASGGGRRIDYVVTSDITYVTDTTGNLIGDFSISGTQLRQ